MTKKRIKMRDAREPEEGVSVEVPAETEKRVSKKGNTPGEQSYSIALDDAGVFRGLERRLGGGETTRAQEAMENLRRSIASIGRAAAGTVTGRSSGSNFQIRPVFAPGGPAHEPSDLVQQLAEYPQETAEEALLIERARSGMAELRRALFGDPLAASGTVTGRSSGGFATGGLVRGGRAGMLPGEVPAILERGETPNDMVERLSRTTVLSLAEAQTLVESYHSAFNEPMNFGGINIAIDPAMAGSDITVVNIVNRPADPLEALRARLLSQYHSQTEAALSREGYTTRSLTSRDMDMLRGTVSGLQEFLRRHIQNTRWEELTEVGFWGHRERRIGIFLLSGRNGEQMVGVKLSDPTRFMAHDLSENDHPSRRRAWAVGELIGWGMVGAGR